MKRKKARWTPRDDAELVELLKTHTRAAAAAAMGLSKTSIDVRLKRIGARANSPVRYTPEEKSLILAYYAIAGDTCLAARVGRHPASIRKKARMLGVTLVLSVPLTAADIAYVQAHADDDPFDVAVVLGRRVHHVAAAQAETHQRHVSHAAWAPAEIELAAALVPEIGTRGTARRLQRPLLAVKTLAVKLGLQYGPNERSRLRHKARRAATLLRAAAWPAEEVERLGALVRTYGVRKASTLIDRPKEETYALARHLGVSSSGAARARRHAAKRRPAKVTGGSGTARESHAPVAHGARGAPILAELSPLSPKRRWTAFQREELRRLASEGVTAPKIAIQIGRTPKAVSLMATRLGVNVAESHIASKVRAKAEGTRRRVMVWSCGEDAILRENYRATCLHQMEALLPGRSRAAIAIRAGTLGLTRSRSDAGRLHFAGSSSTSRAGPSSQDLAGPEDFTCVADRLAGALRDG